jgi:hypothetical protein
MTEVLDVVLNTVVDLEGEEREEYVGFTRVLHSFSLLM